MQKIKPEAHRKHKIKPQSSQVHLGRQSKVFFDPQSRQSNKCQFCYTSKPTLIKFCDCVNQYHHACLLQYICNKIKKMKSSFLLSDIKCKKCSSKYKFQYSQHQRLTCKYYNRRLKNNCCDRILITIIVLTLIFLVLLSLGIFSTLGQNKEFKNAYIGIIILVFSGLIGVILLFFILYMLCKYLLIVEIVLYRVLPWEPQSNSSDDINVYLPDYFEVRIN